MLVSFWPQAVFLSYPIDEVRQLGCPGEGCKQALPAQAAQEPGHPTCRSRRTPLSFRLAILPEFRIALIVDDKDMPRGRTVRRSTGCQRVSR